MIKTADCVILLLHVGLNQHRESYVQLYELVRSLYAKPIIILGGHEHQSQVEYPVKPNASFVNPFRQSTLDASGNDINCMFLETSNYFQELSILDFSIENQMLKNV